VAVASGEPVGIDIEPAMRDTPNTILPEFATPEEIALVGDLAVDLIDGTAATRLWCAKEAVSKALGTGLQGRPKDFEAIAAEADGSFLIQHNPSGERVIAHTHQIGEFLVAYASAPADGGGPVPAAPTIHSDIREGLAQRE
jgi:phosphopantetheinyl transferase